MKKTNTLYWIFTGFFALAMFSSGVQNAIMTQPSVEIISTQLGFPEYFVPFIGIAKILGVIAILIPGYPRIKEWAYAGLFFDLVGATYSGFMAGPFDPAMLGMLIFFTLFALSYIWYHKRLRLQVGKERTSVTA